MNRHENIPELLRKETRQYDRRMSNGWILGATDEDSFLNPDSPWDNILYLLVHGADQRDWWANNFTRKAMEVRGRITTVAST